jgi:hypothetical protein
MNPLKWIKKHMVLNKNQLILESWKRMVKNNAAFKTRYEIRDDEKKSNKAVT